MWSKIADLIASTLRDIRREIVDLYRCLTWIIAGSLAEV